MKYKLVVSDLDGTLLGNDGNVSAATKELIQSYQRQGGIFTVATGRMEDAVKPHLNLLNVAGPAILYNGAKIIDMDKNDIIFEAFLKYEVAKEALKLLQDYEWDVLLYQNGKIYIKEMTPGIEKHLKKEDVECEVVGDLHDFLQLAPTKILIIGDNGKFDFFSQDLQNRMGIKINFTQSEETYLEILPEGASKGAALKTLADALKISIEDVIAIGDHLNDLSMIQVAGLGIAMENAHPQLKDNAGFITVSNEAEGVKEVLLRVLNDLDFSYNIPDADAI
ncbi:HAD family hydrolase [Anoxybacterium hadale]|uniref:HAD family hydrolase n=1 Tax=Anoxybacterium hadale TaxID=3408580 RepID=UPI003B00E8FC